MQQDLRLTVALELTPHDAQILAYTAFICRTLPVRKIHFVHIEPHLELPASLLAERPELAKAPVDESFELQMRQIVEQHLPLPADVEQEFEALEGRLLDELVKQARLKNSDLLIVGKPENDRSPLSARLARQAPCSVLFVPPQFNLEIKNILVPVDFSPYAVEAANLALALSSALEGDKVHLLHLYHVPDGYYRLNESYDEARAEVEKYARQDYDVFASKLEGLEQNDVHVHLVDDQDRNKVELLAQQVKALDAQLLVMGSKGRTNLAALFLGSLTEKLIQTPLGVPMLVVKEHQNLGFLQALIEISEA
ncbi:MAG: universal stress protein [Candidatus Sericytochromatia bacterium]